MFPQRRKHNSKRICEYCDKPLVRSAGEADREWLRRAYCGRSCAIGGRATYRSAHEMLLQNSELSDDNGCWNWTEYLDPKGYGRCVSFYGETLAHRVSYAIHHGVIPDGLHILHACDNRACVNPEHLRAGTNDDNVRDRVQRGRGSRLHGSKNPRSILTDEQVLEIRTSSLSNGCLGRKFGVSATTIGAVRNGKTWKDGPYADA